MKCCWIINGNYGILIWVSDSVDGTWYDRECMFRSCHLCSASVCIYIVGFLSGGNNFSVQLVEYIIELSFKLVMISSLDGPSSPRRSMLMTYLAALL